MTDRSSEFYDLTPLGCPGWEHSAAWFRDGDSRGGAAELVAIRPTGSLLNIIVECPIRRGAAPDPARLLKAVHNRIRAIETPLAPPTPDQVAFQQRADAIPPEPNALKFLWSLFNNVPASRPLPQKDAL